MSLWLPPKVSRELRESTAEHAANVTAMVDRFHGMLRHFTAELRRELGDDHVEMIFVPPNAQLAGAVPGRYHVMRYEAPYPPALFPVTGPDGEFVEPDSGVIRRLVEGDLQNPHVVRERERREREVEDAAEREREREAEERREEIRDRMRAAFETSVSMTDVKGGWTQNKSKAARVAKARRLREN